MENPSYYAVLPACVRYDKRLKANEKLLFAELTALSQKDGYAWAGNKYLSELYGVSKETVSRWLSNLQDCGYIKINVDQDAGNSRRIIIFDPTENQYLLTKTSIPLDKNIMTPIDENVKHNTTRDNTLKEYFSCIISRLNEKAGTHYRDTEKTRALIRARLNEKFTLEDFYTVIDKKCAQWGGEPEPGDKDMRVYLRPETLFGPKFDGYLNAPGCSPVPKEKKWREL